MIPVLAGVDVGTSSVKAAVYAVDGRQLSQARAVTPWTATPTGAETSADSILGASRTALQDAMEGCPDGRVVGVGVAGMGESGILLDARGHPLGPVVAWYDRRDAGLVDDLHQAVEPTHFARTTGLPPAGQWSLTKHRWLVDRHPELAAARRRLNVAEWVIRGLGGAEVSEQSLASRTGWLDVTARRWWSDTIAWSGLSESQLPELVVAGTQVGTVGAEAGLPLATGAALTVAGHDHQVAAVGAGAYSTGDELDSCGSAEAIIRTVPAGLDADRIWALCSAGVTVGWHALADRWCLLGGTQGGLLLREALTALGKDASHVAELDALALRLTSQTRNAPAADPGWIWQTALDQAGQAARAIHDAMTAVVGQPDTLVLTGGWSNSAAFAEVKRRTIGPFRRHGGSEAGTRGAALFAGLAADVYSTPDEFPAPGAAYSADIGSVAVETDADLVANLSSRSVR